MRSAGINSLSFCKSYFRFISLQEEEALSQLNRQRNIQTWRNSTSLILSESSEIPQNLVDYLHWSSWFEVGEFSLYHSFSSCHVYTDSNNKHTDFRSDDLNFFSVFFDVLRNTGLLLDWCCRQHCLSDGNVVPPLEMNDTMFIFSIMDGSAITKYKFVWLLHLRKLK